MMRFEAPWGRLLKVVTFGTCALLLVVAATLVRRPLGGWIGVLVWAAPLVLLGGGALFTVRGYRLEARQLLVERLLWATPIGLDSLRAVEADPEAMKRSIRLLGNGGLFAFAGLFSNRRLGRYRAWATDPARAVVLDFGDRKLVVTPARPDELVRELRRRLPELG